MYFSWPDASNLPRYLGRRVVPLIAPIVLLGFLLDLFVMPLPGEIVLQPVLALLVGLGVVAETQTRYEPVKKLADTSLGVLGLLLLAGSLSALILNWGDLN